MTEQKRNARDSSYGDVIKGHKYDGIKEYDNPMPGWWMWLFVLSIAFAVVYFLGINFLGIVDTYEDDLAQSLAELEGIREAYAASGAAFIPDAATLAAYIDQEDQIEAGAQAFASYCMPCHAAQGQGLIGPNLTDDFWIHGGSNVDIFNVITVGVPDKGMTPWDSVLSPDERAQLVAFIRSIYGTNPPNAKEPQGDSYQGAS